MSSPSVALNNASLAPGSSSTSPGAHPRQPVEEGSQTFFGYLQRKCESAECRALPKQPDPKDPYRQEMHICVNFHGMDVLTHAKEFYENKSKKKDRDFSLRVVQALQWLILLPMAIPLAIFALLRWIVSRMRHRDSRDDRTLFPLLEWSLTASLWIVFVPHAWLTTRGGLSAVLYLHSHTPSFQHSHSSNIKKGNEMTEERETRLQTLEALHKILKEEERKALEQLRKLENPADTELVCAGEIRMNSAVDHRPPKKGKIDDWRREATSTWQRIVADCKVLKEEIRASKDEISEIRDIARTQTNKQMTGYKGISDWAKDALDAHNESIRALSAVSVLGAGLSYTSIVSATRGNISYMCCSFVLFMICLMFATAVQVVLTWCSHRANYPFPNPHLWEIIVAIGVYGAGASMAVAIIFLLVSVQLLSPNPSAPPVVTFSPKASAYVTYALLGSIFIIVLLAFSTFASANGFKFLIWRRSEERLATKAKRLEDFV